MLFVVVNFLLAVLMGSGDAADSSLLGEPGDETITYKKKRQL